METWVLYAILSMLFAGIVSILAKFGLENINSDLALAIRTSTIFILVTAFVFLTGKTKDISILTTKQILLLVASGIATTISWVFYYRAMKDGLVSYVAAIDKASIIITIVLSFIIFKEPVTAKILVGAGLIFAGMIVLVWK